MKNENIFKPWAGRDAFEKALADAPDWIDDVDIRDGIWTNPRLTAPGQHPFELSSASIAEQLGTSAARKIALINAAPSADSVTSLVPPDKLSRSTADLVLLFVSSQQEFRHFLQDAASSLSRELGSTLWLCHPRQQSTLNAPLPVTTMLKDAEEFGLYNDAFLPIDPDWVCLRLRRYQP